MRELVGPVQNIEKQTQKYSLSHKKKKTLHKTDKQIFKNTFILQN